MYAQLASSVLGGGDKGSSPSSTASKSGDASAGVNFDFSLNNSFTVGGSGKTSTAASATTAEDSSAGLKQNTVLYVALAFAGVAAIGLIAWTLKRRA